MGEIIKIIFSGLILAVRATPFIVTLGRFISTPIAILLYIVNYFGAMKFPITSVLIHLIVSAIGYYYAYTDYGIIGLIFYIIVVTPYVLRIIFTILHGVSDL